MALAQLGIYEILSVLADSNSSEGEEEVEKEEEETLCKWLHLDAVQRIRWLLHPISSVHSHALEMLRSLYIILIFRMHFFPPFIVDRVCAASYISLLYCRRFYEHRPETFLICI